MAGGHATLTRISGPANLVVTDGASARQALADLVMTWDTADGASWRLQDTKPGDWWFKGRDLEAWKKANPKWARVWSGEPPKADGRASYVLITRTIITYGQFGIRSR